MPTCANILQLIDTDGAHQAVDVVGELVDIEAAADRVIFEVDQLQDLEDAVTNRAGRCYDKADLAALDLAAGRIDAILHGTIESEGEGHSRTGCPFPL